MKIHREGEDWVDDDGAVILYRCESTGLWIDQMTMTWYSTVEAWAHFTDGEVCYA